MADRGRGRGRGAGGGDRGGRGRGGFQGPPRGGGGGGGGGFQGPPRGGGGGGGGGFRGGRGGAEGMSVFGGGNFPQPDPAITKAEDASVKDLSAALASTSLTDQLPRRPGYGTQGRKIVLWTNYFDLKGVAQDTFFYRYSVAFQPDNELPKPKRKRLIQLLLQKAPFAGVPAASDWAQVLITSKKIGLGGQRKDFALEWFPADGEPLPPPAANDSEGRKSARKRNNVKALVEELGTVSLAELMKDISGHAATYPLKLETIQALNIILSYVPSSDPNVATAGGNKFYPFGQHAKVQKTDLGTGLEALRGYFSSVRTSINRILVNVNVATGAFYKSGPLLDILKDVNNGIGMRNESEHKRVATFVRKLRFETNYIRDDSAAKGKKGGKPAAGKAPATKRKVHNLFDLSTFGKNAINTQFDHTEPNGEKKKVTVQAYFQSAHGIVLKTPQAPLVNYGSRDSPKWIPGELCSVLPGQLARRLLLGDQTREMIRFAARQPSANAKSIMDDGLHVTSINPVSQGLNTNLTKFSIKVDPNMLTVHGRILVAPKLSYKSNSVIPRDGAWNLDVRTIGQKPFTVPKKLPSWNCLVINEGNRDTIFGGQQRVLELLGLFRQSLQTYGIEAGPVQPPKLATVNFFDLQNRNTDKVQKDIDGAIRTFPAKPQFLFVLLPSDNALLYDCIKYVCDIRIGIPNVCNIGKKWSNEKGQAQYFANVALKFNQKLGGVNHFIDNSQLKPLDAKTIVFGIDVTHPSPGSAETSPSIAGVVASIDARFSQYPASIRTQKGKQEMVAELEEMIIERLKHWQRYNKGLPNKVIVYRDGVSEGQYRTVMEQEYPAFIKAFDKLYGAKANHPKISIVVVGKRHHTRFYPTNPQDADGRTGNPLPGTVVDRGVTGEKIFDFFLLAHKGLQGTSKPAHYVVLKDENRFGADQLQILTHNLCYTFARATRAVSICPPAYYADLLCERGRSYLHGVLKGDGSVAFSATQWQRNVHPAVVDSMFYL
ncbi:Piwi domain-domain-containing protein [Clohesyomyces aquaticus]|uniref:Piwi domain-domain-containing protein n=1 Tax=Clohesyomyces aquaticus TaxID=1231657 RepID=A0A1Y1YGV6_9PLEO|nr:Piwi domain-domain-containing protein [Clohesyomyces aquaticus]